MRQEAEAESQSPRAARRRRALRIPIAYKFSLAIALVISVGMGLLGIVIVGNQTQVLRSQIEGFGRAIVAQMAESAKEPILANDILTLEVLVTSLESGGKVLGTAIFSNEGKVLVRSGITPFDVDAPFAGNADTFLNNAAQALEWQWERSPVGPLKAVSFISPVRFQDVTAGHVLVTFSRSILDQSLRDSIQTIVTATVVFIVLGLVMSYFLGRRLSRPIHHLMDASQAIQEGRYHHRIRERRNDEIGHLISAFNSMAEGLLQKTQVEAAFSRFVSPKVAVEILANLDQVELGGKQVEGTVLFADLVGYTSLSERVGSEEVAALLNEYFSYISRASNLYHGTVDKYMGDCAMLVFGIPEPDEEHCFHGICCALLFQRLVDRLNAQRIAAGLYPIQFRLGLNTGSMLAGNMGCRDRMQYTVVGDAVNLASRLCTIAGPGEIVITEEIYLQPTIRKRIIAERYRSINVRGKTRPVNTYLVRGLRTVPGAAKLDQQLERFLAGAVDATV